MAIIRNSILKLEPHQREAYDEVGKLLNERGKAAVIFPTGCGKSFVVLQYILEHPDERILFLSHRHAINDQMYEYIIRFIGGDFRPIEEIIKEYGTGNNPSESLKLAARQYIPNIECSLYQTMSAYGEKESVDEIINKLKPDVIIVDEMHHLKTKFMKEASRGVCVEEDIDEVLFEDEDYNDEKEKKQELEQSNKWGEKFHKFLDDNPNAKLIGLSATPIRTDGANVVERIFGDSIANEISLLEAIERGIIYPPKYVVPDFVREDELQTLLEKIENATGDLKEELKEKYDELVKKSSNTPGIPELMQEHVTEKDGKYIIFCKDINDMHEKMEKAKEWFGGIDEEPEVYGIHSRDNTSSEKLKQFNNSNSEHLKLMYCVGMIDEGVHLNDVSGVVLAARTGSRPTYLQRIGRAISSGKDKKQTTVIDLVNNNEILYEDKVSHGYEVNDLELLQELVKWIEENDGNLPVYDAEKSYKERTMARRLGRINNKYLKYVDDERLLDSLNDDKYEQITEILELGNSIGMFVDLIELPLTDKEKQIDVMIDNFLDDIEIKGVRRDFRDFLIRGKKENHIEYVIKTLKKMNNIGIDISNFSSLDTVWSLAQRTNSSVNIQNIEEVNLNPSYTIGRAITNIGVTYRKFLTGKKVHGTIPTEEQVGEFASLGIKFTIDNRTEKFIEKIKKIKKLIDCNEEIINISVRDTILSLVTRLDAKVSEEQIISIGLDPLYKIGSERNYLGVLYRKGEQKNNRMGKPPTESQIKELKKLGIVFDLQEKRDATQQIIENMKLMNSLVEYKGQRIKAKDTILSLVTRLDAKVSEEQIISIGLDPSYKIGQAINNIGTTYRKWKKGEKNLNGKVPTHEQIEELQKIGISLELIDDDTRNEEILQFFRENKRPPRSLNRKKASEMTDVEKTEKSIYIKWTKSTLKKIVDKYVGKESEEILEEYRPLVEEIREYGYIGTKGKTAQSMGKVSVKDISNKEIKEGADFIESISKTKEKNVEGVDYDD